MAVQTFTTDDMAHMVVVLRGSFEAHGVTRSRGEVLDDRDWPFGRIARMVETRYLEVAPYNLLETIAVCPCGRKWQTEEIKNAHDCPARPKKGGRRRSTVTTTEQKVA
jgi:hypothetical protein